MWQAGRAFRDAKARLEQAPQAIASAQGGIVVARRQLWLARQRPDLLDDLAAVEADRPTDDRAEDFYRRWSTWKQRVASARAAIDVAVRAVGL